MRNPQSWTDTWQPGDPLFLPGRYQEELPMIEDMEETHIALCGAARWSPKRGWQGSW